MSPNYIELVGSAAAILTTISFMPQAIAVLRTKETRGISLSMYLLFSLGVALWSIYGWYIDSMPVFFANSITLCFALIILGMKIKEPKNL